MTDPKDAAPYPAAEAPIESHSPEDYGTVKKDAGDLGRPQRGPLPAKQTAVWIDPDSAKMLRHEFGSLGNALYFTAKGIALFRKRHGLSAYEETEGTELPDSLGYSDLAVLREILWYRVDDWRGTDEEIAPTVRVLRKIEALLYSGNPLPGSLPPLGSPPRNPRPKSPRTKSPGGVAGIIRAAAVDAAKGRRGASESLRPLKGSMSPRKNVAAESDSPGENAAEGSMSPGEIPDGESGGVE